MSEPDPVSVLSFIKEYFSLEDLKTLCFQLYVPFDDLAGEGREAKARELIAYMHNRGRMPDLTLALARERPEQYRTDFGTTPQKTSKRLPNARNPRLVFISHAHQDAAFAHRLADDMRRENYEVWIAPDSISLGERWVEAINRALQESGVFLLVSTPQAVESEWVQDETNYAVELASKRQIRFIRLDVQEADLPPFWTVRQHVSFRRDYGSGLKQLLVALRTFPPPTLPDMGTPKGMPLKEGYAPVKQPSSRSLPELPPATSMRTTTPGGPDKRKALMPLVGTASLLVVVLLATWVIGVLYVQLNGGTLEGTTPLATEMVSIIREPTTLSAPTSFSATPKPSTMPSLEPMVSASRTPSGGCSEITHIVQAGENIYRIGLRYGLTAQELATYNGIANLNVLTVGQQLRIPPLLGCETNPTLSTLTSTLTVIPEPQAGDIRTVLRGGIEVEQVYVPAGHFIMGMTSELSVDFEPERTVGLKAFWIDRTETTNRQYFTCQSEGSCPRPGNNSSNTRPSYYYEVNLSFADYPVIYVDWNSANSYCSWAEGRLPTEAEWEKAARGTNGLPYPWGNMVLDCRLANVRNGTGSCATDTTAVGTYPAGASPYGAWDMVGNVLEWVEDWYQSNYYIVGPAMDPSGPLSGTEKVARGGSWYSDGYYSHHVAVRFKLVPAYSSYDIGFRCASD